MKKSTQQSSRKQAQILGVGINSTGRKEVLSKVEVKVDRFVSKSSKLHPIVVISVNPEGVVRAQKDKKFKSIVNSADISFADGVGLIQAGLYLNMPNPKNKTLRLPILLLQGIYVGFLSLLGKETQSNLKLVKGRKLFLDLISLAGKKGWRVFLYGGEKGEAKETVNFLRKNYKGVKIDAMGGPQLSENGVASTKKDKVLEKEAIKKMNSFAPHLLFLAFSPPKQEKWFFLNRKKLNAGAAVMVGGTFNYIAGKSRLPLKWMEGAGLEWLWRLLTEPKRIKRILTAFPIFPFLVFLEKMRQSEA